MSYNGWDGNGSQTSAWATWNMALWVDNEEPIYRDRMRRRPETPKQVKEFCLGWFPRGIPDMDSADLEEVYWSEIASVWSSEYEEEDAIEDKEGAIEDEDRSHRPAAGCGGGFEFL